MLRDPLEWIANWHHYMAREALKTPLTPNHNNYTGNISYNIVITRHVAKGKRALFAAIRTQHDFLKTSNNRIGLGYVLPVDRIDLASKFLSEKIGQNITISTKNMSSKKALL
jgi:hypothetical protein